MKGISLLETLVVIAIIAIMSLTGINTINNFRRDAALDNVVNEFISTVKSARNKSMNGQLLADEAEDEFETDGLPEYGISVYSDTYKLVRRCKKIDGSNCSTDLPVEIMSLNPDFMIITDGSLYFQRISGDSAGKSYIIKEKNGSRGREISISENFIINISKI